MKSKRVQMLVLLMGPVFLLGFVGCSGEKVPSLATVSGTITDKQGEPMADIKVTFSPNPEKGCRGRTSQGVTDENGIFQLSYQLPDGPREGASIGWHKVTFRDLIPSRERSSDGSQIPSRISRKYVSSSSTPSEFEVKEGENEAKFSLDTTY